MRTFFINLLVSAIITLVASVGFAYPEGGEIPWPLNAQHPITQEHSKGLWLMGTEDGPRYYNVEILSTSDEISWIRVAEIDTVTGEVITFGEGYYNCNEPAAQSGGMSNQGAPYRYLYMFPNSEMGRDPYLLRMVEVEMNDLFLLGISIFEQSKPNRGEHILGYRVAKKPLECDNSGDNNDLACKKYKPNSWF